MEQEGIKRSDRDERGENADSGSLFSGSWLAANLANLAVLANDFFVFCFFFLPCRRGNCTLPLISRRAAYRPQRALAVTGGRECLFISLFLTLPKGTYPLKMVNGLWFRSVCALLSYLIKYLQPLIGPSGSGACWVDSST